MTKANTASDKSIDTLIEDIQDVLVNGVDEIREEDLESFSKSLVETLKVQLLKGERSSGLRMSNIGTPCERKLWYGVNKSSELEPLTPEAKLKFLYGNLIEELIILLARMAGHKAEGMQDAVEVHGIPGHRDVVFDGVIVDVKSASSFSYKKFAEHKLAEDDAFGYIPQLQGYLEAGQDDPIVTEKNRAAFLAVDKTLGYICLDFHERKEWPWQDIVDHKRKVVGSAFPPDRGFEPVPKGKSGNLGLNTFCSYCNAKELCHPNLRTFLYSTGPEFLTTVTKLPNVYEVPRKE